MACAGLLATAMASPSFAADLPRPAYPYKAPVYVAPAFSWSGFYVGLNGGYGWGTSKWSNVGSDEFGVKGWVGGGTIGYNMQTGIWVWGLEGDLDYSTIKGSDAGGFGGVCGPFAGGCETRNRWLATARGRVGYAWDRWLPYLTGGAAFGDIRVTPDGGGTETKTKIGWTAGAGIEYAFLGAWSAKLEYLYVDLGKASCSAANCGIDTDVTFKTNLVRVGVNYRF
jgi:outer membrane immunogenic protein